MAAERVFELHPEADAEIDEAFEWYRVRDEDVAARFLANVNERLQSIREGPERWPVVRNVTPRSRFRLLDGFPYTIFYRVGTTHLLVVALAHQKRQALYWAHRERR